MTGGINSVWLSSVAEEPLVFRDAGELLDCFTSISFTPSRATLQCRVISLLSAGKPGREVRPIGTEKTRSRQRDVAKCDRSTTVSARRGGAPGRCMLLRMRNQSERFPCLNSPESVSSSRVNRRDFIKTTSLAAGALAFGVPTLLRGQNLNSKLNIACIGAMGGKGRSDTDACAGENIVALCDVDSGSASLRDADEKISEREVLQRFPPDAGSDGQSRSMR